MWYLIYTKLCFLVSFTQRALFHCILSYLLVGRGLPGLLIIFEVARIKDLFYKFVLELTSDT